MSGSGQGLRRVEQIMGMPISIDVRDPDLNDAVLDGVFDWFRTVDARFSTYKADSEISRLNRGELTLAETHPDVQEVLDLCEQLREETNGYFDIRAPYQAPVLAPGIVPMAQPGAVDPSGLVKGWAVDRAAQILDGAGAQDYYINAGGDLRVRGRPAPALHWRVGIQHPMLRDKIAAVVPATDLAIATSGAYERGQHIMIPGTAQSPTGILSVTITGPDLATADAYATAAYAMGAAGPHWTARLSGGYAAMTIMSDGRVLLTPGFVTIDP